MSLTTCLKKKKIHSHNNLDSYLPRFIIDSKINFLNVILSCDVDGTNSESNQTPKNRNGIPKNPTPTWYHQENPCQV